MSCWYSVGQGEVKTLFLCFKDPEKEQAARRIVQNLQARNHIPRSMELIFLPDGMRVPTTKWGEWSIFLLTLPLGEDENAIIATLVKRFRERLGLTPQAMTDMTDAMAHQYTQVVMKHRVT